MINLTKDVEEKNKIQKRIEEEKNTINLMIRLQNIKKNILTDTMQRFADYTEGSLQNEKIDSIEFFLNNFKNSLALSETNIYLLNNLISELDEILEKNKKDEIEKSIEKYNFNFNNVNDVILNNTIQIEQTLTHILAFSEFSFESKNKLDKLIQNVVNKNLPQEIEDIKNVNIEEKVINKNTINKKMMEGLDLEKYPENTLIVSEKDRIVLLPYTIQNLNSIYEENKEKYISFKQIIDEKYIVSFDEYKNPSLARFRETFKLMRVKEKTSVIKAFELGMELFFYYNLHPAIISACKNLEELSTYLNCLDENKTHEFDCFKIRFDMAPIEVKESKFKLFGNKNNVSDVIVSDNKETVEEILAVELESKAIDIEDIKEEIKTEEKDMKEDNNKKETIEINASKLNIGELEKVADSEVEITKIVIPNKHKLRRNEDYNIIEELKEEANKEVDIEETAFEDVNKAAENIEDVLNDATLNMPDTKNIIIPDEVSKKSTKKNATKKTSSKTTSTKTKKNTSTNSKTKKTVTKKKVKKEE